MDQDEKWYDAENYPHETLDPDPADNTIVPPLDNGLVGSAGLGVDTYDLSSYPQRWYGVDLNIFSDGIESHRSNFNGVPNAPDYQFFRDDIKSIENIVGTDGPDMFRLICFGGSVTIDGRGETENYPDHGPNGDYLYTNPRLGPIDWQVTENDGSFSGQMRYFQSTANFGNIETLAVRHGDTYNGEVVTQENSSELPPGVIGLDREYGMEQFKDNACTGDLISYFSDTEKLLNANPNLSETETRLQTALYESNLVDRLGIMNDNGVDIVPVTVAPGALPFEQAVLFANDSNTAANLFETRMRESRNVVNEDDNSVGIV